MRKKIVQKQETEEHEIATLEIGEKTQAESDNIETRIENENRSNKSRKETESEDCARSFFKRRRKNT